MKLDITGQTLKITAGIETSLNFKPTFVLPDSNVIPLHIDPSNILSVEGKKIVELESKQLMSFFVKSTLYFLANCGFFSFLGGPAKAAR